MSDVAQILERVERGDLKSADELVTILYDELRRLAKSHLSHEASEQSFQTSDLVHEAYLRLVGCDQQWQGHGHFFVAAAEAMRRILVERARRKRRVKHGGGRSRVELLEAADRQAPSPEEVIVVSDLLEALAGEQPLGAQIVKLHYFAGLSIREAGRAIGISSSAAHRHWTFARAWLHEAMQHGDADPEES